MALEGESADPVSIVKTSSGTLGIRQFLLHAMLERLNDVC